MHMQYKHAIQTNAYRIHMQYKLLTHIECTYNMKYRI